jgi:centromere protein I
LHPIILAFLREYLPVWNGQDNVDTILGILSYIEFEPAEDIYPAYLRPVEQALAAHGISAYVKLIDFYTSLLQHEISAVASKAAVRDNRYQQTVRNLAEHASTMFTSAVLSVPSGSSADITSSILSFYELLSRSSNPHIIPIILPPMHLVYLLAQEASPTAPSRMCGIIGSYKTAFDNHPKPVKTYYPATTTNVFNYCLRDMYNLVWVARGLLVQDQKCEGLYCDLALRSALNGYLSKVEREYAIGSAFNLSNNAWLASLSAAAWRTIEMREVEREGYDKDGTRYHQGPVSERSLEVLKQKGGVSVSWDGANGYKVMVLQWLDERGLSGIKDLMFATVMKLKGAV